MNVEDAYRAIAEEAIAKAGDLEWDSLIVEAKIYESMCSSVIWFQSDDKRFQGNGSPSLNLRRASMEAILFLRDNLLQISGERIYGITFTLHKTGKFNIDYSYDKPAGYDD